MKQMTKKVAFLLADGFEDSEMKNPYEAIAKNGNDAVIISSNANEELHGKKGTIAYTSHLSAKEANAADYEAVIIPGGKSPEKLKHDPYMIKFIQEADKAGITIAAICHGPQLLAEAGLLKGKVLTSYHGIAQEVIAAGGSYLDKPVKVDGNLITSRAPEDEPFFIEEIINKLGVTAY